MRSAQSPFIRQPVKDIINQSGTGTNRNDDGSGPTLRKSISTLELAMMGVGCTVGTGIFYVFSIAVPEAGPAVILAFRITVLQRQMIRRKTKVLLREQRRLQCGDSRHRPAGTKASLVPYVRRPAVISGIVARRKGECFLLFRFFLPLLRQKSGRIFRRGKDLLLHFSDQSVRLGPV